MIEKLLDFFVEIVWLFPIMLLLNAIIGGILIGIYLICKKHPNKFTLLLRRGMCIFSITWSSLFLVRTLVIVFWEHDISGLLMYILVVFMIIDLIITPTVIIVAVTSIVRYMLKTGLRKKWLKIISVCLLAVITIDIAIFCISRNSSNVFEEIYYAMRDAAYPWENRVNNVKTLRFHRLDDLFANSSYDNMEYTSDGIFRVTRVDYTGIALEDDGYPCRIYCIHETKKLVFYHSMESGNAWAMYEYDLKTNELSYSCSYGNDNQRDQFLDKILTDWLGGLNEKSKFDSKNLGKYSDKGYRDAEAYIYEIIS